MSIGNLRLIYVGLIRRSQFALFITLFIFCWHFGSFVSYLPYGGFWRFWGRWNTLCDIAIKLFCRKLSRVWAMFTLHLLLPNNFNTISQFRSRFRMFSIVCWYVMQFVFARFSGCNVLAGGRRLDVGFGSINVEARLQRVQTKSFIVLYRLFSKQCDKYCWHRWIWARFKLIAVV